MRFHLRRGGELVGFILFSCWCVSVVFPEFGVKVRQSALGDGIWPQYWKWGDELVEGGVRLVVFGDSWVDDTVQEGEKGKGRSWPGVFCDEINCTSHYNFATSQPTTSFPQYAQTGALISNPHPEFASTSDTSHSLLPDLATQIRQFITLIPTSPKPTETIFVLSLGFWDIYHLAGVDFSASKKAVDAAIDELFRQLDILYASYSDYVLKTLSDSTTPVTSNIPFRVVIPKLMDPTLLPGWMARPAPLPPASAAEEQKQAVYLTERWNAVMENRIGQWINSVALPPSPPPPPPQDDGRNQNQTETETESATAHADTTTQQPIVVKDVFSFDLPTHLLNSLIEHQLKTDGTSGGAKSMKPNQPCFESVRVPCMRDLEEEEAHHHPAAPPAAAAFIEVNGKLVCPNPEAYLFWDGFRLGAVANDGIGKAVGTMIGEGRSVRKLLDKGVPRGDL